MPISAAVLAMAVLVAGVALWRLARVWQEYRGQRVITCPENRRPAGVVVNARHAAASAFGGRLELRLSSCSRWPERAGCGQRCVAEIAESPQDCLVRHILAEWYRGKGCASCGRPFGDIEWVVQKPALLRPEKISVEWNQVPADRLFELLAESLPLCFACHTASTLVREHPELVIARAGQAVWPARH